MGSWQEQYAASCTTKLHQTRTEQRSSYPRDIRDSDSDLTYRHQPLPRDRSFVLDRGERGVQLRHPPRHRSSSRGESPRTDILRHGGGSRPARPVSVPYAGSDLAMSGARSRLSLEGGAAVTATGLSTTPRRSHSDCYTRSSPNVVRKFKVSSRKK